MVKELGLKYLRSKELLYRWMDVAAVTDVIFRSHQGSCYGAVWCVGLWVRVPVCLSSCACGGWNRATPHKFDFARRLPLLWRFSSLSLLSLFFIPFCSSYLLFAGNLPEDSWQVYSSTKSLHCLAHATRLHALFVPYRKGGCLELWW